MHQEIETTKHYLQTLEDLKSFIKTAQIKAHLAVNKEILICYWQIGRIIIDRQEKEGWGTKVIEKISRDLQIEFPQMRDLSSRKTIVNGWSRNVLIHQINSDLYSRQATNDKKVNNFQLTLPAKQSDLAEELVKDRYNLDFIDIKGKLKEKRLENALIDNVIQFLLELGSGFTLVGKQYHLVS